MNRRTCVYTTAGAIVDLSYNLPKVHALSPPITGAAGMGNPKSSIFVSPSGDDGSPGTASEPLRTFHAAQLAARELKKQTSGELSVYFRTGTYYLPKTVVFTP